MGEGGSTTWDSGPNMGVFYNDVKSEIEEAAKNSPRKNKVKVRRGARLDNTCGRSLAPYNAGGGRRSRQNKLYNQLENSDLYILFSIAIRVVGRFNLFQ